MYSIATTGRLSTDIELPCGTGTVHLPNNVLRHFSRQTMPFTSSIGFSGPWP